MVPAAQVERAVGHEEAQLIARRPALPSILAAAARVGLRHRSRHGDDDLTQPLP